MYTEDQIKDYLADLQGMPVDGTLIEYVNKHSHDKNFPALIEYCCNDLLDIIQRLYYKYSDDIIHNSIEIKTYIAITDWIEGDQLPYYRAVAEIFKGNAQKSLEYIRKANAQGFFYDGNEAFTDIEFANCFLAPFKAGFPGFWTEIYNLISTFSVEPGVLELCKAVPLFYNSSNSSEIRNALEIAFAANPDSLVVKELLAITLYNSQLWGNAVAFMEQIGDEPILLYREHLYFMMAWCYGKIKEPKSEIETYEKIAEIAENGQYVINNLGNAYYKAKLFNKALDCFKKCLDNNWDTKYAANNYIRTLLALGRFKDAKDFVKSTPHKILKTLLDKVASAGNSNQRTKADRSVDITVENDVPAISKREIDLGIKKQQFTSEKILEDELALRIESGIPVFGKQMKIFRRKGIYGRQYILSNGRRPDLLAEDSDGNLYVIELKKDSGYDDAYAQTIDYLEWFDENWSDKVKDVFGIICLNDPTQELLDKVHSNNRVRVFEYQISYTER